MLIGAVGTRGTTGDLELAISDRRGEIHCQSDRLTEAVGCDSMARSKTAAVTPPNGPTMFAHSGCVRPRTMSALTTSSSIARSNACNSGIETASPEFDSATAGFTIHLAQQPSRQAARGYTAAVAFDPVFARDVVLPLAQAAYAVMDGNAASLPAGYSQTSLIQADAVVLTAMSNPHPAVVAMTKDTDIFGLMGRNAASRTAFLSFRGTSDVAEWVADIDAVPDDYQQISGFGQVHAGFQDVYELVRANIAANLATAAAGCDQILITGHSLGAALAVLAGPTSPATCRPTRSSLD